MNVFHVIFPTPEDFDALKPPDLHGILNRGMKGIKKRKDKESDSEEEE